MDKKIENNRLEDLENKMNAEREVFISKDYQLAMALNDNIISVETRFTKGDAPPPPADNNKDHDLQKEKSNSSDEVSELTESTCESKANLYAAKAVKEVASQYADTIALKYADLEQKEDKT